MILGKWREQSTGQKLISVFIATILGLFTVNALAIAFNSSEPRTAFTANDIVEVVPDTPPTVKELHRLVNAERTKRGLKPFTLNETLNQSAKTKSLDMSKNLYFAHKNPETGVEGPDLINQSGIVCKFVAENLAETESSNEAVTSWMKSPTHARIIIDPAYDLVGYGIANSTSETYYITQHFCDK